MKVLFVGLGSIGTRHLQNLHTVAAEKGIPVEAWALRSSGRELPAATQALLAGEVRALSGQEHFDAAFITNPTSLHFESLRMLRGKADALFIEKPIFDRTEADLEQCLAPGQKAYVAAPMRWCGVMLALKRRLPELRPYSVRVICSRAGTSTLACLTAPLVFRNSRDRSAIFRPFQCMTIRGLSVTVATR